ncbi:coronin binding protein [Reticulomyxa filosa]|uniref:Coronin binding protein n=1 Tax=Reticulomyxa filosa TaxID=46433 RepID=X6NMD1_RETFI|nr:coronin binding protein [Reticulomyxa filosa]|eukprot:ETO26552.1 coronin binding protein [Reticulomyxa filosa]
MLSPRDEATSMTRSASPNAGTWEAKTGLHFAMNDSTIVDESGDEYSGTASVCSNNSMDENLLTTWKYGMSLGVGVGTSASPALIGKKVDIVRPSSDSPSSKAWPNPSRAMELENSDILSVTPFVDYALDHYQGSHMTNEACHHHEADVAAKFLSKEQPSANGHGCDCLHLPALEAYFGMSQDNEDSSAVLVSKSILEEKEEEEVGEERGQRQEKQKRRKAEKEQKKNDAKKKMNQLRVLVNHLDSEDDETPRIASLGVMDGDISPCSMSHTLYYPTRTAGYVYSNNTTIINTNNNNNNNNNSCSNSNNYLTPSIRTNRNVKHSSSILHCLLESNAGFATGVQGGAGTGGDSRAGSPTLGANNFSDTYSDTYNTITYSRTQTDNRSRSRNVTPQTSPQMYSYAYDGLLSQSHIGSAAYALNHSQVPGDMARISLIHATDHGQVGSGGDQALDSNVSTSNSYHHSHHHYQSKDTSIGIVESNSNNNNNNNDKTKNTSGNGRVLVGGGGSIMNLLDGANAPGSLCVVKSKHVMLKQMEKVNDPRALDTRVLQHYKCSLQDLLGYPKLLRNLCEDKFGSRYVQKICDEKSTGARDLRRLVEIMIIPHGVGLCKHIFGNYIVQKLLEITCERTRNEPEMESVLCQRVLGMCRTNGINPRDRDIWTMDTTTMTTMTSAMTTITAADHNLVDSHNKELRWIGLKVIEAVFSGHVRDLSMNQYSCRVIQRILVDMHYPLHVKILFLKEICSVDDRREPELTVFFVDQYGNQCSKKLSKKCPTNVWIGFFV